MSYKVVIRIGGEVYASSLASTKKECERLREEYRKQMLKGVWKEIPRRKWALTHGGETAELSIEKEGV